MVMVMSAKKLSERNNMNKNEIILCMTHNTPFYTRVIHGIKTYLLKTIERSLSKHLNFANCNKQAITVIFHASYLKYMLTHFSWSWVETHFHNLSTPQDK